jgi:antitoxin VapB
MDIAKIFKNGRSQAVRLPKEYRINNDEVYIKKFDDMVLLIPIDSKWKLMESSLDYFTDDFMGREKSTGYTKEEYFMKRYMLDTNICIYIIKKKPMEVFNKFITKKIDDIYISSITLNELEYGVEKSTNKIKNGIALASFLAPVTVLPYASDIAKTYGEIRTSLEKKVQL